jgi:hypothetical protein
MQAGPGGTLDLRKIRFRQVNDRTVEVSGSRYIKAKQYRVKLEGAGKVGFNSMCILGIRDPRMMRQIDTIVENTKKNVAEAFPPSSWDDAQIFIHLYGKNAIMGEREPLRHRLPHEVAMVIETSARTQERADIICDFARQNLFTARYEGQKATAGSVSMMFDGVWHGHGAYRWIIHHLMPLDDPMEIFPISLLRIGADK